MRRTRVLSVSLEQPGDVAPAERAAANRDAVLAALDRAAPYDPDFVCFPEIVLQERAGSDRESVHDVVSRRVDLAEPVPGPATEAVGEKARELDSYVVVPTLERAEGTCYNSAVLVGPNGDVAATYRKRRPPLSEIEPGVTPGEECVVVDTPFGRVGFAVCFDLMYPELGVELARERADLVFFASQFDGGERVHSWARDYGFHVVKCTADAGEIVTPAGETAAAVGDGWPPARLDLGGGASARLTFAEVNTDCATYAGATSTAALTEIQRAEAVSVTRLAREGQFVLASSSPATSVADLESEYELERLQAYLDRTEAAAQSRASAPSEPSEPSGPE